MNEVETLQENHHPENRRVVGQDATFGQRFFLNLQQVQRPGRLEQRRHDAATAAGDSHALAAQETKDAVDTKFMWIF